jgi:(2Fe-2S) ferredoxin
MGEALSNLDRCERWAFICEASDCRFRGSPAVREALAQAVHEGGCAHVAVVRTGCLGLCGAGPAVVAYPSGDVHLQVQPGDARELATQVAAGAPLKSRAVRAPQWYRDRITSQLGYAVRLLKQRYQREPRSPE